MNPEPRSIAKPSERKHLLEALIAQQDIMPCFQPIVDLTTSRILGYEVLSRGGPPFCNPERLFAEAAEHCLTWDLECTCRTAALQRIAAFPAALREMRYFLNVSPEILSDPRFQRGFTLEQIHRLGLDHRRFVIEVTERSSIPDYTRFERQIRHYAEQGFHIALDDFGAGHSGLLTLVAVAPHFIKLDRGLISSLQHHHYKRQLVRAMVSFARTVGCHLVAEGVESVGELAFLHGEGVRFAQGFLLGRPEPTPAPLSQGSLAVLDRIREPVGAWSPGLVVECC